MYTQTRIHVESPDSLNMGCRACCPSSTSTGRAAKMNRKTIYLGERPLRSMPSTVACCRGVAVLGQHVLISATADID